MLAEGRSASAVPGHGRRRLCRLRDTTADVHAIELRAAGTPSLTSGQAAQHSTQRGAGDTLPASNKVQQEQRRGRVVQLGRLQVILIPAPPRKSGAQLQQSRPHLVQLPAAQASVDQAPRQEAAHRQESRASCIGLNSGGPVSTAAA